MLNIVVPGPEMFDDGTQEFSTKGDVTLTLEHSLVSLSKWESIYEKPFLSKEEKTTEQILSYVQCMTVTRNVPEDIYSRLSEDNIKDINEYIDAKMSATWFSEIGAPKTSEVVTAELIYYWMVSFNIPFECQKWHINRLFALIRVCNIKSAKPKKMSRAELAARNSKLNAERKKQLGTSG